MMPEKPQMPAVYNMVLTERNMQPTSSSAGVLGLWCGE